MDVGYQRPRYGHGQPWSPQDGVGKAYLKTETRDIFLPIIGAVYAEGTVGRVQTQAECGIERPSTNVKLTTSLIREDGASGTEDISEDMHLAPCLFDVIGECVVEFVGVSGVLRARTELLEESDFVVDTERSLQSNHRSADEELWITLDETGLRQGGGSLLRTS